MDISALIDKYLNRFGVNLPYALVSGATDEDLAALIQRSLDTGQPLANPEVEGQIY